MRRLERNIVANFVGQSWAAGMALVLVPVYIRLLGVESYGLIGFYAVLQASLQVLDLGLAQTLNREMARYSARQGGVEEARDLVRTVEVGYWGLGLALGLLLVLAGPWVARHWIRPDALTPSDVAVAVSLMGVVIAMRWPLSLYEGGLLGLQRQVLLNVVRVTTTTAGGVGAVLVLAFVSPTIRAYFTWQVAAAAIQVAATALALWGSLRGAGRRPAFVPGLLLANWRFAAGMSGITISAVVLLQLDKVLLSRLLPLETFGHYALAGVVSGVVPSLMVGPFFNAVFPRLTALVASGDEEGVRSLYHSSTQVMVVAVVNASALLACFAPEVLGWWTGESTLAAQVAPIVRVLVIGMALNALMTLPYALQLAHGWTGLAWRINVALAVAMAPSIVLLTSRYGVVGAASVWAGLNVFLIAIGLPLTHRRILRGDMRRWIVNDVLPPAAAGLVVVLAARWLLSPFPERLAGAVAMVGVLGVSMLGASLAAPSLRGWAWARIRSRPGSA